MSEQSGSRYGIMESLNNKKIKAKQELSALDKEGDQRSFENESRITSLKRNIEDRESAYEREHEDSIAAKEVELKLFEDDYNRTKAEMQEEITEAKNTYKLNFEEWKKKKLEDLRLAEKNHERYKAVHEKEKKAIQETIDSLERGISDLKEMSKETSASSPDSE